MATSELRVTPSSASSIPLFSKFKMTPQNDRTIDRVFIFALFGAALITHFFLTTRNWTYGFMIGHEFRQTQTAVISYYIDKQNNFSIHYETPIMGKPWEIPLEFPFYEWCVVWLSRATGWEHFISARTISLTCFYLSLPAVFILLGQVGINRVRRLMMLALLLVTPVYIFYSRAFLIDPMAFMFSVWFLALFIETMRKRRWGFLIACAVCGTAAGLIKSLVLFAWLFPAAIYGAYCLWRNVADKAGGMAIVRTIAWGVGAVVVPAVAMGWWVKLTDDIKAQHASAYIFTSENLAKGNYGTFDLSSRTSPAMWSDLFLRWREAIAQPWIIGAIVALGLIFFPRERWRIGGAAFLFMAAQLLIPYAYAWQDYYYYICAAFIIFAFGFVLNGVLDSGLPRIGKWILVLLPFVALLHAHRQAYFQHQSTKSHGGSGLTAALRDLLPHESVIIVAGSDWAAIIPYYSKHRALMIRNGLEGDGEYLAKAFKDLEGEDVSALVLIGNQRSNQRLVDRAADAFEIDRRAAFSWADSADVYLNKLYRPGVVGILTNHSSYDSVKVVVPPTPVAEASRPPTERQSFPAATMAVAFKMIQPTPTDFHLPYGYGTWEIDGDVVINAHPDSDIWMPAPATSKSIELVYGIRKEAYDREGDKTSGVEFIVDAEAADGTTRRIFSRTLDPVMVEADRGKQTSKAELDLLAGEKLVLRTRPYGSNAFDWAFWGRIKVE
jgi:hypothetical protein